MIPLPRKRTLAVLLIAVALGIYYRKSFTKKPEGATIEIINGKLKGSVALSRVGRNYYEFLGIPYGEPPVNQLRFEAPKPYKEQWKEIYDATEFRDPCKQLSLITHLGRGSEDCLYLNVYSSELTKPSLPVLVFFYGGLFMEGQSNMYGAKYFMDEDVVLVTLNYRIGALGFLNTFDGLIRGNMGLKDQNLALRWVQENISKFGGDPKKVTIFGQSAGSAAVHYHMLSPLSKGLFSRAISQSGVSLNPWAFNPDPAKQAIRYAKNLNCPTHNSKEMVACLKSVPSDELIDAHREVLDITRDPITVFVPTAESVIDKNTFVSQNPYELIKNETYVNKVPWLTGLVSEEGLIASTMLLRNSTLWNMEIEDWKKLTPSALYYKPNLKLTDQIGNFYVPGLLESNLRNDEVFKNLTHLFSDRHFHNGIHEAALIHSKYQPVYLYYFVHPTQFSLQDVLLAVKGTLPAIVEIVGTLIWSWLKKKVLGVPPLRYGICHADEVHLFFNVGPHDAVTTSDIDYEISRRLVKLWSIFADDPSKLAWLGTKWPSIDSNRPLKYMEIGHLSKPKLIDPPNLERLKFWDELDI